MGVMLTRKNEKGNVLFLILIAVVLFAALSYAVTQSTRGGNNTNREQIELEVSELLQYFTSLNTAILRMKTTNGVDDTELSFANAVWVLEDGTTLANPPGHNPNCINTECEVFHPDGGGMYPKILSGNSDAWFDTGSTAQNAPGHAKIQLITHTGVGTSTPNLIITYAYLNPDYCDLINKKLGVTETDILDTKRMNPTVQNFSGEYTGTFTEDVGVEEPEFAGKPTFGVRFTNRNVCKLFHTLVVK